MTDRDGSNSFGHLTGRASLTVVHSNNSSDQVLTIIGSFISPSTSVNPIQKNSQGIAYLVFCQLPIFSSLSMKIHLLRQPTQTSNNGRSVPTDGSLPSLTDNTMRGEIAYSVCKQRNRKLINMPYYYP